MKLVIGSSLRFVGTYREDGDPFDPEFPHVDVAMGSVIETRTVPNRGLVRVRIGVYATTVRIADAPLLRLTFAAEPGRDGATSVQTFQIASSSAARAAPPRVTRDEMIAAIRAGGMAVATSATDAWIAGAYAEQRRKPGPPPDMARIDETRSEMIAELRAAGIVVDPNTSDAFLRSACAALSAEKGRASARLETVRRKAWR